MRRFFLALASLFVLLILVYQGCTDASLEEFPPPPAPPIDNKVSVLGEVCTQNPEDLEFPVRVLFLVDCSESMEVNDPPDPLTGETGRERAVRTTVEELLDGSGDVEVSVVRFHAAPEPLTVELDADGNFESYFSSDLDYVRARIPALGFTERTTNFVSVLSEGYTEIRNELMDADQESLALSTYHVILLTDGIPDVEGDETRENSNENVLDAVEGIMELGRLFRVGHMTVNTALIASGNPLVDSVASDLLGQMADQGEGTFRSFDSGGELNFLFVNLTALKRVFTMKAIIAQNINAEVSADSVYADSDGDGLADYIEWDNGTDPYDPDSDGDGCRDGLEYRYRESGMDPADPTDCQCYLADYCFDMDSDSACDCTPDTDGGGCDCVDEDADGLCDCIDDNADGRCDPSNYFDADGDGLFDCEERYTGTNRAGADSDGDGLPDFLEVRFNTAPDIDDVKDDADWDAVLNGEEVKTATDPTYSKVVARGEMAYRYHMEETEKTGGITCYSFGVDNITITDTTGVNPDDTDTVDTAGDPPANPIVGPGGQGYSGHNRILIFAGEVPFDDMEAYARFRVACVEAVYISDGNYKEPPSGKIEVTEADFVELTAFDPALHCIPPGGRP